MGIATSYSAAKILDLTNPAFVSGRIETNGDVVFVTQGGLEVPIGNVGDGSGGGGGGFQIGMTRLQSSAVMQAANGSGRRALPSGTWTIDTEYGAPIESAPPITDQMADWNGFSFDEAGWYVVRFRWIGYFADPATAPDTVNLTLNYDNVFFNMFHDTPVRFPDNGGTTSKYFNSDYTTRPLYMHAGEIMYPIWYWSNGSTAVDSGYKMIVEITRVG